MEIFYWLEMTKLAEIVGVSLWGYPIMIVAHSFGLAIVVGIIFMLNFRILGIFSGVSFVGLHKMMKIAWLGFVINFLSGVCLFVAQASYFVTTGTFLIKVVAIFAAMIVAAFMQKSLSDEGERWDTGGELIGKIKGLAIVSLVLWSIAIIAGRLIAYLPLSLV